MNDFQEQSLKDYRTDPSPTNLSLLAISINPSFELTKKNTPILKALIDKLDGSQTRESALINFVQPATNDITIKNLDFLTKAIRENEILKNPEQISKNINEKGKTLIDDKNTTFNSYFAVDKESEKERKQSIFNSLFGDHTIEGTFAWSLIHKEKPLNVFRLNDNERADSRSFRNVTILQPEFVIEWCEEVTGSKQINFYDIYCNRIYESGNFSNYIFKINNLRQNKIIEYKGNSSQFTGYGTINASMPMQNAFSSLESIRTRMQ